MATELNSNIAAETNHFPHKCRLPFTSGVSEWKGNPCRQLSAAVVNGKEKKKETMHNKREPKPHGTSEAHVTDTHISVLADLPDFSNLPQVITTSRYSQ